MRNILLLASIFLLPRCNYKSDTKDVENEYVKNLEKKNALLKKELDSINVSKKEIKENTVIVQKESKQFEGDDFLQLIDLPTSAPLYDQFINSFNERPIFVNKSSSTYLKFLRTGFEVLVETNRLEHKYVHTIYFFPEKCTLSLPAGLSFSMDKQAIQNKLGFPNMKGGGDEFQGKTVPYWDKWIFDKYAIHVTYNSLDNPTKIILMSNNEDVFFN